MTTCQVHNIFCDDIRHEVGGKVSFMGCYSERMIFQSLPAIMPRLSIAFWVEISINSPLKQLRISIEASDGSVISQSEWPVEEAYTNKPKSLPDATKIVYSGGFNVANVEFKENWSYIEAVFDIGSERIKGAKLLVLTPNTFPEKTSHQTAV